MYAPSSLSDVTKFHTVLMNKRLIYLSLPYRIPTADEENDFTSNMVIYADCHASNKGMFLGLILTVVMTGMLILGFIFSTIDK